jgi:proline iminopeptidase
MTLPYPPPRVLRTLRLPVSGGHVLQVQESGSERGIPALVLHGGPGSGCSPLFARFFDPARYRVLCMDQRGAGASCPAGATEHNTTAHLLHDLRVLRSELGIGRWLVVGGSWGATLALLHAVDAPRAVTALLLRSVFLARDEDVERFFGQHTDAGRAYWRAFVGPCEGQPLVAALAQVFQAGTLAEQQACAQGWWQWERQRAGLALEAPAQGAALDALVQRYRIQSHYLHHGCWLRMRSLLARCSAAPHVPTLLLHGTQDEVCPLQGAIALQRCLPHALLRRVDGVGHDPTHPAMVDAMVRALGHYAAHGRWAPGAAAWASGAGAP